MPDVLAGGGQSLVQRAVVTEAVDDFLERAQGRKGELFTQFTAGVLVYSVLSFVSVRNGLEYVLHVGT